MGSCGAPQLPIPLLWATCLEQDGKCNLPLGPPGEARRAKGQPVLGDSVYVSAFAVATIT
jgi:hypothetical protein